MCPPVFEINLESYQPEKLVVSPVIEICYQLLMLEKLLA